MDNRDGFDIQKLDREVDELLSDVKNLLNENAEPVNESGGEDAADGDAAAPELPQEEAPETPAFPPEAMSDATVVYKPLTYYEQSKPAYQTARRAQYEREREQQRQERERLRLEREAEEERKMQELEQRKKNPRRRTRPEPPADEQAYAKWLYEQGNGEETVYQREQVAQREERRDEPQPEKKRKRHPVRALLLVLLTLVVASAAALLILARQPESENALGARRKGCSTILLAGTDQEGYRTDTMMLLSVDRENGKLSLVSIPRDTLVFCEYSVPKINSAYGWAGGGESGMKELMQRVTEIIGFEPDGYVLIDLAGFEKLIDCMGGVEFNVPMDMQYSDPTQGLQIDLKAGEQKLNGDEAMQLVRFRSGYAMADLDRVSVQRAFVSAALSQWLTPGKLVRLPGALKTLSQYTDSNLTAENYLWLAEAAAVCDMTDIRTQTLPGTATNLGGGSYYVLDAAGVAETVNACCNPYEQGIAVSDLSIRVG